MLATGTPAPRVARAASHARVSRLSMIMRRVRDSLLLPHLNRYFRATAEGAPAWRLFDALFDVVERGIAAPRPAARRRTPYRRAP